MYINYLMDHISTIHPTTTLAPVAFAMTTLPNFLSMSFVAKGLDGLRCHLVWR